MPDAQSMAERYAAGVQNNAGRWAEGMRNPRRSPKQAALAAAGKWAERTTAAIQGGHYAQGIQRYDEAEAVRIATEDNGAAYAAGVSKRLPKVQRAFQILAPLLNNVSQTIQNMPQDTDAQREQRLIAARRQMIQVGRQYRQAAR